MCCTLFRFVLSSIICNALHMPVFTSLSSPESPAPFAVNGNTSELVVTAPLDREESENYRLLLVCTVKTETVVTKVETPLDVFVDDEDDNAPYVNGTNTVDVVISFNRTKVTSKSTTFTLKIKCSFLVLKLKLSLFFWSYLSRVLLLAPCLSLTGT